MVLLVVAGTDEGWMDAGGLTNRPTSATAATPTMSAATVAVRLDGRRMLPPRSGPRPTPWMAVWQGAALLRLFLRYEQSVRHHLDHSSSSLTPAPDHGQSTALLSAASNATPTPAPPDTPFSRLTAP